MRLDAFHLPALPPPTTTVRAFGTGPDVLELHFAELTPGLLSRQIDALTTARSEHLASRPVDEIIRLIDRVAGRLLDDGDRLRTVAVDALGAVTGQSARMVRAILDGMAADWRAGPLRALVDLEFGVPPAIDRYVDRGSVKSRAYGPELTLHVFSGNVPGVAVTSIIRSLLVKSATLGKTASGEPVLAPLFARALQDEDEGLGACIAVAYWSGGDDTLEEVAHARADAIVAYGGSASIDSVRARAPASARFIGYGNRVSFGAIGREALASHEKAAELADHAAAAVASFDQQGCVSPHIYYVEEGGSITAADWAGMLAASLDRLESELPRGALSAAESAAIRQARAEAEFAQLAGQGHQLHTSAIGTLWTVIFDPDPGFAPSCLNRLVRVKPVTGLADIPDLVAPVASVLQTVGVEAASARREELAERLGLLGASRITTISGMAWPPPTWHHDGRPPLTELVRWCDLG